MEACSGAIVRFLHNPCVLRACLGGILVLVATVVSATALAGQQTFVRFQLPSKNISCGYLAGSGSTVLRCDIRSGLKPEPRGTCELDWTGISMGRGSARPTCAGDTVADPKAPILAYGQTWRRGPFACLSSRIGLSCANRAGYGFFLSRQRWQVS